MRIFVYESLSAGTTRAPEGDDAALLASGLAMRDAIVDDLLRLAGVAVTCAVGAAPGCGPARRWRGAALSTAAACAGEEAQAFVAAMAAAHDLCWIVAPETGGELARLHEAVGEARWIGCDAASIRRASSKRETLAALAAAGVPTPLDPATSASGRWIVKPDDGAGCLSTRVFPGRAAAQAAADRARSLGETPVLEPFVEGEALSVSLVVGAELAAAVAFNRQRIGLDADGRLSDQGVQVAALDRAGDARVAGLEAVALEAVRALPGLEGFVGVDMVWNEERGAVVIEVNPRVTCAYVGLSAQLGRNLAGDILRLRTRHAALRESRDGVDA